LSASTSTRRTKPWSCASTRRARSKLLDRTQPGLPLKKGRAGTLTHDYKRHGTTTLFAALDVATGKVIGRCLKRHRHQEFLRFLRQIDRRSGSICISSSTITRGGFGSGTPTWAGIAAVVHLAARRAAAG
jgi:hypothetical protein